MNRAAQLRRDIQQVAPTYQDEVEITALGAAIERCDEARELPGHQPPRDWFEETVRRGCTDLDAS